MRNNQTFALRLALLSLALVCVLCSVVSTLYAKYSSNSDNDFDLHITAGTITLNASDDVNGLVVIPGTYLALTEANQPVISVENGSESCFVFLKITTSDEVKQIMDISCGTEWTLLDGYTNVYCREFAKDNGATTYNVFSNYSEAIWVSSTATKAQIDAISGENITFTAYAVQQTPDITNAATAWQKLLESQSS